MSGAAHHRGLSGSERCYVSQFIRLGSDLIQTGRGKGLTPRMSGADTGVFCRVLTKRGTEDDTRSSDAGALQGASKQACGVDGSVRESKLGFNRTFAGWRVSGLPGDWQE